MAYRVVVTQWVSLMLIGLLSCRDNSTLIFCLWDGPTVTWHQGQGHRHEHEPCMPCHAYVYWNSNAIAWNTVSDCDMAIIVQITSVKYLSSLRRTCELGWWARSYDWEKIISNFSRTIFTTNLMGIAWWTVSDNRIFLIFIIKIYVTLNEGRCQYN